MNVKSYRGKTADECMKKLKSDLGSDAVILQSRTIKPILGRFGRPMHEIVAADDTGAVLDKFAEKAGDRRTAANSSRAAAAPAEAQPRLTLSRGIIGNTALASQAQPPLARRERLTLEEAAQLHEQGAYDRLVAAGVLNSQTAATSSSTSSTRSTPAKERGDASSRDMQLVYSNTVERNTADQVGSAPVADKPQSDDRISRLEKQIALLTSALQKQAPPQATATPVVAPRATTAAVVTRQNSVVSKPVAPVGEFEGSQVAAQKLSREAEAVTTPQARLSTAMQPDVDTGSAISANTSDSSTDDALQAEASATAQTSSPSLGGFLRYRLPAQDAEKAPKAAAETKPAAPTRGNGTRAKQARIITADVGAARGSEFSAGRFR